MKIIIGLGNPEKKYDNTRHNIGFILINKLQKEWDFPDFKFSKKFNAKISKCDLPLSLRAKQSNLEISDKIITSLTVPCNDILLVKPQTFMNLSGTSVKSILDFYKLTPENIIVIHDDIDIELGKYKIASNSSSAGHNGVQNIIDQLGTQKFKRIRIGIGQSPERKKVCPISGHDFVLGKFSNKELRTFKEISKDILREIRKLL